jgi:hypothetical protein
MTKILALILLTASFAFTADVAADKPNPAVEKAMSASLSDADKAYSAYKAALAKATDKAVAALETAKKDALKKGDLDTANAVEAKIKDLKAGALEGLEADRSKLTADLLGDKPKGDTFLGKWKISHPGAKDFMVWTVSAKGVITRPGMTGQWKAVDATSIIIAWSADNWTDTIDSKAGTMITSVGGATFDAAKMDK